MNGDVTKELSPGEFETGMLHIKPPAEPVDVCDYFVVWADEVTIAQNLFNRLVSFWIAK
jgi:HAMP domain-containing protein